jgi:dihydrofolate reductase
MRSVRYSVVMSLDGYIAGPGGEADWITRDPEFDFAALFGQFDTILVGRRTFDGMVTAGRVSIPGSFSRER